MESSKPLIRTGLKVLILEDDEDDYEMIQEVLEHCNHQVFSYWVKDGEEALKYLYRKENYKDPDIFPRPDLIFLDNKVPLKSGMAVCENI